MRRRAALGLTLLATTCSKPEVAAPSGQRPDASANLVASPLSVSGSVAATGSPVQDAAAMVVNGSAPAPAVASDPRCEGSFVDLTAVLLEGNCLDPRAAGGAGSVALGAPQSDAGASVRVSVVGPGRLAPGAEGIARITWTNTSAAAVELSVGHYESASVGLGVGAGAAPPVRTIHVFQSTTSADGKRSFNPTWKLFGAGFGSPAHLRLAPSGSAELRVAIRARGFLPGKDYPTDTPFEEPRDPLPAGRYHVALDVDVDGMARPGFDLEVGR
jgi:hypothetical protein